VEGISQGPGFMTQSDTSCTEALLHDKSTRALRSLKIKPYHFTPSPNQESQIQIDNGR